VRLRLQLLCAGLCRSWFWAVAHTEDTFCAFWSSSHPRILSPAQAWIPMLSVPCPYVGVAWIMAPILLVRARLGTCCVLVWVANHEIWHIGVSGSVCARRSSLSFCVCVWCLPLVLFRACRCPPLGRALRIVGRVVVAGRLEQAQWPAICVRLGAAILIARCTVDFSVPNGHLPSVLRAPILQYCSHRRDRRFRGWLPKICGCPAPAGSGLSFINAHLCHPTPVAFRRDSFQATAYWGGHCVRFSVLRDAEKAAGVCCSHLGGPAPKIAHFS